MQEKSLPILTLISSDQNTLDKLEGDLEFSRQLTEDMEMMLKERGELRDKRSSFRRNTIFQEKLSLIIFKMTIAHSNYLTNYI